MNADDIVRDCVLRFLYERHKSTRGITKIPIGIRDLQREMKNRHSLKQNEVSSNLDYLIQVGWVREIVRERSFVTPKGMELSQEQIKYKISDVGINHLEGATMFKKSDSSKGVNITNIQGVTVVGDGNVVNTHFTELARALEEFDKAIAASNELNDAQKLDATGDLSTIRTQISKQNPSKKVISAAWEGLRGLATISSLAQTAHKVGTFVTALLP